jgi:hypothetical protein
LKSRIEPEVSMTKAMWLLPTGTPTGAGSTFGRTISGFFCRAAIARRSSSTSGPFARKLAVEVIEQRLQVGILELGVGGEDEGRGVVSFKLLFALGEVGEAGQVGGKHALKSLDRGALVSSLCADREHEDQDHRAEAAADAV